MSYVYIPQVPSRFDSRSKLWVPQVDISPAKKFGEPVVLLPPEANRLHTAPLLVALRENLRHITADDYLVALGDPSIIAITACLAVANTGGMLRLLKWDRQAGDYIAVEAKI